MDGDASEIVLFFGRFHPLVLHVPIGFLTLAFLLEICSRFRRFHHFKPAVGFVLLLGAAVVGLGSSVFHPESSRVARVASGGRHGFAQSVFQVGGNAGSAIGPLLAALIVMPLGIKGVSWVSIGAIIAMVLLWQVGKWYAGHLHLRKQKPATVQAHTGPPLSRNRIIFALFILLVLIFSKYFYLASMTSYFTFFLIDKFGVTAQQSQLFGLFTRQPQRARVLDALGHRGHRQQQPGGRGQ